MRTRLRALAVSAWVAVAAAVPLVALSPGNACADTDQRAVLVVDTGSAALRYCVVLNADSVSGIELIQLASAQHGLQYRLGFGGKAVCQMDGVGPDSDDCFADYPDFWGYWRGDGSGGWTWSSIGAASTRVEPGDVEGWSWGSGQDASTHPQPPATTFDDVCPAIAPSPTPSGTPGGGGGSGGSGHGGSGGGGGSGSGGGSGGSSTEPSPSTSTSQTADGRKGGGGNGSDKTPDLKSSGEEHEPDGATTARALPTTPASSSGPAAGGLVASAVTVLLVLAGAGMARRRGAQRG